MGHRTKCGPISIWLSPAANHAQLTMPCGDVLKWRYPPSFHPFERDFPWNQPSSELGVPPVPSWKPPLVIHALHGIPWPGRDARGFPGRHSPTWRSSRLPSWWCHHPWRAKWPDFHQFKGDLKMLKVFFLGKSQWMIGDRPRENFVRDKWSDVLSNVSADSIRCPPLISTVFWPLESTCFYVASPWKSRTGFVSK